MVLLKGVNQQLIMMQNLIVTLCNSLNKAIDEEVKNNVMSNINQPEL